MSDLVERKDAIVALRNVWNALWEIDIPSPTVPEYIEHHEQVQGIMKMVQDMIDTFPCTESQCESVQDIIRCKECKYFEYDHPYIIHGVPFLGHLVCTKWGDGCRTDENGFCFMAERRTK